MSERSVAEIIGWHRLDDPYGEVTDAWTRDGREWDYADRWGDTPTADDLLAWLRCDAYFLAELMHHQDTWHIKFVNTDSGLDGKWFAGPTLLAALESAVRAVAGES